jgi:16S rRNA (guanine966-N2)-methyltransferase
MRIISGSSKGTRLLTLEGTETRPTLDRVKESLFSIINFKLQDINILDLFSGSGALGLESLSRGAKFCAFCDNSGKAIEIINKNIEKTKFKEESLVLHKDYEKALKILKEKELKFGVIFLDPPYKTNYDIKAVEKILEYDLLDENGIMIIETDLKEKIEKLKNINNINIYDVRNYGRVWLVFLNRKG